jgi:hypothetical protein
MEVLAQNSIPSFVRETSIFYILVFSLLAVVVGIELFWFVFRKQSVLKQGFFTESFRDEVAWAWIPCGILLFLSLAQFTQVVP